jgi:hypothetical protein
MALLLEELAADLRAGLITDCVAVCRYHTADIRVTLDDTRGGIETTVGMLERAKWMLFKERSP